MPLPEWWLPSATALWRDIAQGHYNLTLLARWWAQGVFFSLAICAADFLAGFALLAVARVRMPSRLHAAAAVALGAGLNGMLVFALGLLRRIDFHWVLAATVLSALPGLWLLRHRGPRRRALVWMASLRSWKLAIAVPFLAVLTFALFLPVLEYDATMYHTAAARWYEDTHRIGFHAGIRFNAQPHLPALLYLRHALLLGDDVLIKLFNVEMAIALGLALGHFARRKRISAAWPLLFAACSPVYAWVAQIEYSDFAMSAWFGVASVLAISSAPAWVTGLVLGFAAASKLQGMVMVAILGVAYLITRRDWRSTAILAGGVIAVGAPWWIRSQIHTGSPAAPFFLGPNFDAEQLFRVSASYGAGRGLLEFLQLPWNAVALAPYKFADPFSFGPGLLMLIVAGLSVAILRKRPSRDTIFVALAFLGFAIFWFRTGQVMRYLSAAMPLLAILFALAAAALRLRERLLIPLALAATVATFLPFAPVRFRSLPPVTFDDKERMLAETLRYYVAARELNRVALPTERAYLWFCEDARYYVRAHSFGDWFGTLRYGAIGPPGATPQQLLVSLRGAGFRYLLVDRDRALRGGTIYSNEFLQSGFARAGGALPPGLAQIYSDGRYVVWRIE